MISATAMALMGYIGWFMILLGVIIFMRFGLTISGKKLANSFDPDGSDVCLFSQRLCRAHANCYESFPFIGGLMLFTLATQTTDITDPFAMTMLLARVIQSITHVISVSVFAVQIRFAFFLVQYFIGVYWLIQIILLS